MKCRMWSRVVSFGALLAALSLTSAPAGAEATFGAAPKDPEAQMMVRQWNGECIACHTAQALKYPPRPGLDLAKLGEAIINPFLYEDSDHAGMACKTCHGKGYVEYPHTPGSQQKSLDCAECHAQLAFRVQAQFDKSVHAENFSDRFGCSTCHDPHTDRVAKQLGDPKKIIAQDNGKCMECHNDDVQFALYGGTLAEKKARPDIDLIHDWLPNTERHWQAVRCVECHTPVSTHSKLAVSHEILNKERAQRDCVTCHSQDTTLQAQLYRHVAQEEINTMGFLNSALLGNVYVIGATRNVVLDSLAYWLIGLTATGVAGHAALRMLAGLFRRWRKS